MAYTPLTTVYTTVSSNLFDSEGHNRKVFEFCLLFLLGFVLYLARIYSY